MKFTPIRDERCSMVNFDPDSARPDPELLNAVVRERDNSAGVYGTAGEHEPASALT